MVLDPLRKDLTRIEIALGINSWYHITPAQNVPSILKSGLVLPDGIDLALQAAVRPGYHRKGIHLAPSIHMIDELMEDLEYRTERIPGEYALLKINLPRDWPVEKDPVTMIMDEAAWISYEPIPPKDIEVVNHHYITISRPYAKIRERPGEYAGYGSRVRVKSTGREGEVTDVVELTRERYIMKVRLDGELQSVPINANDVVELLP